MITGSLAVAFYGRPRFTHDLDIVVDVFGAQKKRVIHALHTLTKHFDLFFNPDQLDTEARRGDMVSILDKKTGTKIDLWIRADDAFSREEFSRRSKRRVYSATIYFVSPEDLIIKKLSWFAWSQSARHLEDAYAVYHGQKQRLDLPYMEGWIKRLGLTPQWQQVLTMPNPQR